MASAETVVRKWRAATCVVILVESEIENEATIPKTMTFGCDITKAAGHY